MIGFVLLLLLVSRLDAQMTTDCYIGNLGQQICYLDGDLTKVASAALVNAANVMLQHGGGIAAALRNAGGPTIQDESNAIIQRNGALSVSQTAVTGAGNLNARNLIHVVGPIYNAAMDALMRQQLRDAILNTLRTARLICAESVSLPPVSGGIFQFPLDQVSQIIFVAISDYYFMYDTDGAKLSSAEIAAGVATTRLIDRSANCTLPLVPKIVNVVAWHNIPAEVTAISAGFVVARDAETSRRTANNVPPGATYTLSQTTSAGATTETMPITTQSTVVGDSSSTSTLSSTSPATTDKAGTSTKTKLPPTTATKTTKTTTVTKEVTSPNDTTDSCGAMPFPCWSLLLFGGLLFVCVCVLTVSCFLFCRVNKNSSKVKYRSLRDN